MSLVLDVLTPFSDHYRDCARGLGCGLRVDAAFLAGSASGPMVYAYVGVDAPAGDPVGDGAPDTFDVMGRVPPQTAVEWVVDAAGQGELHWFTNPSLDVVSGRIGTHVVGRRSKRAAPPVPLSDRVVTNDLGEIEALLRARGHAAGFTEKQIAAAEKKRGVEFPPELRLLFSLVKEGEILGGDYDGDDEDGVRAVVRDGLVGGTGKIGNVVDATKRWGRRDALPAMPAASPNDVVQPAYASPLWIVFADDWGGNAYALDLVPGPHGARGQIVQFDHERDEPPALVADSLTSFLRGELHDPEPWGPPADQAPRLVHTDSDRVAEEKRLTAANAHLAGELSVASSVEPLDLTPLRGSRTLKAIDFSQYNRHPDYDLSALTTMPALQDLFAPEAVWAQIVDQQAFPPNLAAASFTESREMPLAEALEVANAVLAHYGRETFTLERERFA
ncbi:SMI1/KNR4 family protein [Mariniluteicoccus flavus]